MCSMDGGGGFEIRQPEISWLSIPSPRGRTKQPRPTPHAHNGRWGPEGGEGGPCRAHGGQWVPPCARGGAHAPNPCLQGSGPNRPSAGPRGWALHRNDPGAANGAMEPAASLFLRDFWGQLRRIPGVYGSGAMRFRKGSRDGASRIRHRDTENCDRIP